MSSLMHEKPKLFLLLLLLTWFNLSAATTTTTKNTASQISNLSSECASVNCNHNLKCKQGFTLQKLSPFCCPICLCEPCDNKPDLAKLCSVGYRPVRNPQLGNECCDEYTCLLENGDSLPKSAKVISWSEKADLCSGFDCRRVSMDFVGGKCPLDSIEVAADEMERNCCGKATTCVCGECGDLKAMNKWCKLAGDSFEATLIEKGQNLPGKCCDIHICHSTNFTCHFNGEFYPHKFNWKLDECTECTCELGYISCTKRECPSLDCEVTTVLEGQCCPICTGQCHTISSTSIQYYQHDDVWHEDNDSCITCKCLDGKKSCLTESCEVAACEAPVKIIGECCPRCPIKNQCQYKCSNGTICQGGLFKKDSFGCSTCDCENEREISEPGVLRGTWSEYIGKNLMFTLILASLILSLFCIVLLVYLIRRCILGRIRNGSYSCIKLPRKFKKKSPGDSMMLDGSYRSNRNQQSASPLLKLKIDDCSGSSSSGAGLEMDRSRVFEF